MSDIRVTLRPAQPFTDAVVNITALWRLTKQNIPYTTTEAELREMLEAARAEPSVGYEEPSPQHLLRWKEVADHARRVMMSELPLGHYVNFTLVVEGHNRAFLDQFVRELVTGIDIWTGSNRIQDMSRYDETGNFRDCETVRQDEAKADIRARHHAVIAQLFREEVEAGFTVEEARELLPLGIALPVTCTTSLRRLRWILSKRTSFVLQKSLWGPVIEQVLQQLSEWDATIGRTLRVPPCMLRGECPYEVDIEERSTPKTEYGVAQIAALTGPADAPVKLAFHGLTPGDFKDPNPICPIYIDRFSGDRRQQLLALARAKTPDWDKIALDYFAYAGVQPVHGDD